MTETLSRQVTVTYWHNATKLSYREVDPLDAFWLVGDTTVDVDRYDRIAILDAAWVKLNRHDGTHDPILDARQAPSLSVGDVLVLGETAWIVDSFGFKELDTGTWAAADRSDRGPIAAAKGILR